MDIEVLRQALQWLDAGHRVTLVTVVKTWGSSPRPVGAMLAVCEDGCLVGSVSGGCVEEDLIERLRTPLPEQPEIISFGLTREQASRYRLPCGGTLQLVLEPVRDVDSLRQVFSAIAQGKTVSRRLILATGEAAVLPAHARDQLRLEEGTLTTVHGPRWRLLIVGAGQLSRYVASLALVLDYAVVVCDPREEYASGWDLPSVPWLPGMPDDVVLELDLDSHSAVLVLTHDPKLDDMALLEALKTDAFYIGALGSIANNAKRRERLALFDLTTEQISRLRGPVGIPIGSRTPPEIAISILADMIAVRHGVVWRCQDGSLLQLPPTCPAVPWHELRYSAGRRLYAPVPHNRF